MAVEGSMGDKADPACSSQTAPWKEKETGMQNAHFSALETKHADIEARINEENQRPQPDMTAISRLKKAKLKLKEEMLGL